MVSYIIVKRVMKRVKMLFKLETSLLSRVQFNIIPAYAMTINKSQGQTFDRVGAHLDEPVFSHGQRYVALSRCRKPIHVKVQMKKSKQYGVLLYDSRYFTKNVVYNEIF
ncbi:hypothetical protein AVEN_90587-1 [Araneus ventricosus]|uniref:ATP-dependent DNA helicase PIF1 n=1 Tax=Araneus ventricosus TaxID=182803 RepID=A0A4Y2TAY7_ARAVE|nr:hypothetical protein AVEN_90587-1 [Araneus ventricosus]